MSSGGLFFLFWQNRVLNLLVGGKLKLEVKCKGACEDDSTICN